MKSYITKIWFDLIIPGQIAAFNTVIENMLACWKRTKYKLAWHKKVIAAANRENPIAERVNGILKEELIRPGYLSHEVAKTDIQKAIQIYNEKRPRHGDLIEV